MNLSVLFLRKMQGKFVADCRGPRVGAIRNHPGTEEDNMSESQQPALPEKSVQPDAPVLPAKPKSKLWPKLTVAAAVVVLGVAAAIAIPSWINGNKPASATNATVKLGVDDAGSAYWKLVSQRAEEQGVKLELISFSDYSTPNPALVSGDIDVNKFQHLRYLAQFNASQKQDLVPVGSGEIYPIGFYSKKWASLAQVPQGAEVTLSNNPANQVRPLLALKEAGLIAFKGDPGWKATLADVDYAKSRIGKITPIDPTQTAASLDSVDIAFVDSQFAENAKLTAQQEIYKESADRDDLQQYINVFVAKSKDAENPAISTVVKIYQSAEIKQAIKTEKGNDAVFRSEVPIQRLKEVLAEQQKQFS